jgi:hypothetical protein
MSFYHVPLKTEGDVFKIVVDGKGASNQFVWCNCHHKILHDSLYYLNMPMPTMQGKV